MSGLVSGLQNRPQQFESARHLCKNPHDSNAVGIFYIFQFIHLTSTFLPLMM